MSQKKIKSEEHISIAELRKISGAWLRAKRESANLSQRALADKLNISYYTFISQIESGRGKVPSDRYEKYAEALGVKPREFALVMLRNSEPEIYRLIFGDETDLRILSDVESLETRLLRVESKLHL